jgi:hypothetical protein
MGRLDAFTAFTLLALAAAPAGAAEPTRVPSIDEPNGHFELSAAFDYTQRGGLISRQVEQSESGFVTSRLQRQLRFTETTSAVQVRAAAALWEDLALSVEWPFVISSQTGWKLASGVAGAADAITGERYQVGGAACGGACPLFPTKRTVHHASGLGDLKVGLDWGATSDRRDDTRPFWLVGGSVTFPTAKLYDPAAGRDAASWLLPPDSYGSASKLGLGQKVIRYELHTAVSRKVGTAEPYLRVHLTGLQKTSATPSNCDHIDELIAAHQAIAGADLLCKSSPDTWGAKLPWLAGVAFGAELVLDEDRLAGHRVALDLRASVDYTSRARWFNELTDATGKLMATEAYLTGMARVRLLYKATDYLSVVGAVGYGYTTPHDLSGEDPGGSTVSNPNFDWRTDAPGRRFRYSEATTIDASATLVLSY